MIFRELEFPSVQTNLEEARSCSDQGMALMLGYNFDGAIASHLERFDEIRILPWLGGASRMPRDQTKTIPRSFRPKRMELHRGQPGL